MVYLDKGHYWYIMATASMCIYLKVALIFKELLQFDSPEYNSFKNMHGSTGKQHVYKINFENGKIFVKHDGH